MTENPYASPSLPADVESPKSPIDIAEDVRAIGVYTRWAIPWLIVQTAVYLGAVATSFFLSNDHPIFVYFILLFVVSTLVASVSVFMLLRIVYRDDLSLPTSLLVVFLSLNVPLGIIVAILPLLRAAARFRELGIPFGWLGPDAEEAEKRIAELQRDGVLSAGIAPPGS